jgi:hypothetical protein
MSLPHPLSLLEFSAGILLPGERNADAKCPPQSLPLNLMNPWSPHTRKRCAVTKGGGGCIENVSTEKPEKPEKQNREITAKKSNGNQVWTGNTAGNKTPLKTAKTSVRDKPKLRSRRAAGTR